MAAAMFGIKDSLVSQNEKGALYREGAFFIPARGNFWEYF